MRPGSTWRGIGLSDVGLVRSSNQDAFAVIDDQGLWIVADGMGGHAGGDVASRLAVQAITACSESRAAGDSSGQEHGQDDAAFLRQAVEQANRAIWQEAQDRPELTGMGTTVVLLLIHQADPPQATLAHVGDSRAYLMRGHSLVQLTQDHSWVEEQIRLGRLARQEAEHHSLRHVLTRALGTNAIIEPDISTHPLLPEDRILLCTDGLTKMLTDEEILRVLLETDRSRAQAGQALIQTANKRGGHDNITIVTIERA